MVGPDVRLGLQADVGGDDRRHSMTRVSAIFNGDRAALQVSRRPDPWAVRIRGRRGTIMLWVYIASHGPDLTAKRLCDLVRNASGFAI